MRDIICMALATMFFATTILEVRVQAAGTVPAGQRSTAQKPTLKERVLEVPPGTMIQVRLLDKQKIRGRLGEITDEAFSVQTAEGNKVETRKIAFADVKSFKQVKGGKAGRAVVYALAGIGAFLTGVVIWWLASDT